MDKHTHNNHSGGFVLGLLIGVAITLLLVTKKGRKILKILTEEGMDKLGEWEGVIKEVADSLDEEFIDGDDYIDRQERKTEQRESSSHHMKRAEPRTEWEQSHTATEDRPSMNEEQWATTTEEQTPSYSEEYTSQPVETNPVARIKTTTRRFFRGVPKRY